MIIWINGPFGSGKTTLSEKLKDSIDNAIVFDPEHVGFLIHRFVPEARNTDFQKFSMWRRLVVSFILEFQAEFKKDLIIPMTLVEPLFLDKIYSALENAGQKIHHFFLNVEEPTLRERITKQVMSNDVTKDNEIRKWRLDQVSRCLAATKLMPPSTVFLNSGENSPDELLKKILNLLAR